MDKQERRLEMSKQNQDYGKGSCENIALHYAKKTEDLEKRIAELKELLIEYGRHQPGCAKQWDKKYPCRCGWDREKQGLKGN